MEDKASIIKSIRRQYSVRLAGRGPAKRGDSEEGKKNIGLKMQEMGMTQSRSLSGLSVLHVEATSDHLEMAGSESQQ